MQVEGVYLHSIIFPFAPILVTLGGQTILFLCFISAQCQMTLLVAIKQYPLFENFPLKVNSFFSTIVLSHNPNESQDTSSKISNLIINVPAAARFIFLQS